MAENWQWVRVGGIETEHIYRPVNYDWNNCNFLSWYSRDRCFSHKNTSWNIGDEYAAIINAAISTKKGHLLEFYVDNRPYNEIWTDDHDNDTPCYVQGVRVGEEIRKSKPKLDPKEYSDLTNFGKY